MTTIADRGEDATEMYRTRLDALSTTVGRGPPVVFAHGTLMDRTMFAPQLGALSDGYRMTAYDLRARTDRYAPAYDLDDLADDCAAVLDELGEATATIAGMSMGGFMALRFALAYPDRTDALVLIDSMATPHDEADREAFRQVIEPLQGSCRPVSRAFAEASTDHLFGETTRAKNPDLVETWVDRWCTYPGDAVYHELSSWLGREDVTDRLAEIDVPVLIVHGEADASIEPERAEPMLDELPDARMVVISDAGHTSNLERPGSVNDAIRSFLDDVY